MAVGLGPLSTLHPVPGFELGIASAGIKRPGRKDVVVMRCAEGSSVAGVFTLNAFCAAPVILAKKRVNGPVRYLLTNTGNANAGTGEPGLQNAARAEHPCVRDRAAYVFRAEPLVDVHAGAELRCVRIQLFGEPAAPALVAHDDLVSFGPSSVMPASFFASCCFSGKRIMR